MVQLWRIAARARASRPAAQPTWRRPMHALGNEGSSCQACLANRSAREASGRPLPPPRRAPPSARRHRPAPGHRTNVAAPPVVRARWRSQAAPGCTPSAWRASAAACGPVLAIDSLPQQTAQAQERGILTRREGTERGFGLIVAPGEAACLRGQQQGLRRVAQQATGTTGLATCVAPFACGKRQQRAGHRDIACPTALCCPPCRQAYAAGALRRRTAATPHRARRTAGAGRGPRPAGRLRSRAANLRGDMAGQGGQSPCNGDDDAAKQQDEQ